MTLAVPSVPAAPAAFYLLAKPARALCNLDCAYCFFLSKEMPYPGSRSASPTSCWRPTCVGSSRPMRAPVAEVARQGGEPWSSAG